MRAAPLLHVAAGHPAPRRDTHAAEGRCYWCASTITERACRVDDVITDSFTDQDQALIRSSPWLCVACSWAMTGRPPDTLRLWSLAYREDGVWWPRSHESASLLGRRIHAQNKADPSAFRRLLRAPPATGQWICSIADSGQIHTAPFATVNQGGGRYAVRYERVTITTTAAQYSEIDDSIAALLAAGFTKQDIAEQPFPSRLATCGLDLWRAHQRVLSPWRGSGLLDLALFLARKDKTDDTGRTTETSNQPGARHDGQRVERENPTDRVVVEGEVSARNRGAVVGQLRLVGLDDGAQAPDRCDYDLHGRPGGVDRPRRRK